MRDSHDLYHVVTGYGRDGLGEICVLTFGNAQFHNHGIGFNNLFVDLRRGEADVPALREAAEKIGYPLIFKPVAGAGSADTWAMHSKPACPAACGRWSLPKFRHAGSSTWASTLMLPR